MMNRQRHRNLGTLLQLATVIRSPPVEFNNSFDQRQSHTDPLLFDTIPG